MPVSATSERARADRALSRTWRRADRQRSTRSPGCPDKHHAPVREEGTSWSARNAAGAFQIRGWIPVMLWRRPAARRRYAYVRRWDTMGTVRALARLALHFYGFLAEPSQEGYPLAHAESPSVPGARPSPHCSVSKPCPSSPTSISSVVSFLSRARRTSWAAACFSRCQLLTADAVEVDSASRDSGPGSSSASSSVQPASYLPSRARRRIRGTSRGSSASRTNGAEDLARLAGSRVATARLPCRLHVVHPRALELRVSATGMGADRHAGRARRADVLFLGEQLPGEVVKVAEELHPLDREGRLAPRIRRNAMRVVPGGLVDLTLSTPCVLAATTAGCSRERASFVYVCRAPVRRGLG